jgi:adenylylsulfate kinase-like enzyme
MYAKVRRGEITGFTGIDDAYEVPETAEITLDAAKTSAAVNAGIILNYLQTRGFIAESRFDVRSGS